MVALLILTVGLLFTLDQVAALSCLDEQGRSVDWWILYKLPKQSTSRHPVAGPLGEGRAYAFLTSNLPNQRWTLSSLPIDDPHSMPGQVRYNLFVSPSVQLLNLADTRASVQQRLLLVPSVVQRRGASRKNLVHARTHQRPGAGYQRLRQSLVDPLHPPLPAVPQRDLFLPKNGSQIWTDCHMCVNRFKKVKGQFQDPSSDLNFR